MLFTPHPPHMHTHVSTHTHTPYWSMNKMNKSTQKPIFTDQSETCSSWPIERHMWHRHSMLEILPLAPGGTQRWLLCLWFPWKVYIHVYIWRRGCHGEGGGGNWGREKDTLASLQCTAEIPFFKLLTIPVSAYVYIPRQYPWEKKSKNKITINSGKKSTHCSTSIKCQKCPVRACC